MWNLGFRPNLQRVGGQPCYQVFLSKPTLTQLYRTFIDIKRSRDPTFSSEIITIVEVWLFILSSFHLRFSGFHGYSIIKWFVVHLPPYQSTDLSLERAGGIESWSSSKLILNQGKHLCPLMVKGGQLDWVVHRAASLITVCVSSLFIISLRWERGRAILWQRCNVARLSVTLPNLGFAQVT